MMRLRKFALKRLFGCVLFYWYYSHSLKLALYPVNLGLFVRFIGGFDRLFLLRLWSLRKNGIKMVSTNYL